MTSCLLFISLFLERKDRKVLLRFLQKIIHPSTLLGVVRGGARGSTAAVNRTARRKLRIVPNMLELVLIV